MTMSKERTDFLAGVVVTAVEGGINYWGDIRKYRWREDDERNFTEASVEVKVNDTPDAEWLTVDMAVIQQGIKAIRKGDFQVNRVIVSYVVLGDRNNDAGEIDSDAADCIVQAGLFGAIVYG